MTHADYLKDIKKKYGIDRLQLDNEPRRRERTLEELWEQKRKKNEKRFYAFGCEGGWQLELAVEFKRGEEPRMR